MRAHHMVVGWSEVFFHIVPSQLSAEDSIVGGWDLSRCSHMTLQVIIALLPWSCEEEVLVHTVCTCVRFLLGDS